MRVQVLDRLADLDYAQVVMKTKGQVLVLTGEMARQELGKELKEPWVDQYISEYQAVADNLENAGENIEQIRVRLRNDQRNEAGKGECRSSSNKETTQVHFTNSLRMGGDVAGSQQKECQNEH